MATHVNKRKKISHPASFKVKVAEYAIEHKNNVKAASFYGVNERQVRDWRKALDDLKKMDRTKKARRGASAQCPELEAALVEWVEDQTQSGYAVSRLGIRLKALRMCKEGLHPSTPTFSASAGWCTRFMKRHSLSIRQKTKISQHLPKDMDNKVLSFQRYIIKKRKEVDYPMCMIGNMDETPMNFDMPSNQTVDIKGKKTIMIKTTVHEKTHFTVVLACTADGGKLPPMVIFKRKTMPKDKFPPGVVVHVHPKGWMMKMACYCGALLKKAALLVR